VPQRSSRTTKVVHREHMISDAMETGQNWP